MYWQHFNCIVTEPKKIPMWLQGTRSWLQGRSKYVSIGTTNLDIVPLPRGSQDLAMPCNIMQHHYKEFKCHTSPGGGLKTLQCHKMSLHEVSLIASHSASHNLWHKKFGHSNWVVHSNAVPFYFNVIQHRVNGMYKISC